MSANETSSALLKPCPFCGRYPELLESDKGYFICCVCPSMQITAETYLQPTAEAAVAAWNTRAKKQRFTFSKQHVPFGLFLGGTFLLSVGCGLFDNSVAAFMTAFGASVAVSSLFLPWAWDRIEQENSHSVTLRPDLPSCSRCREVPALHKTASGRFRVQCSSSRCLPTSKNRFVHLTEQEAAAAWTEAQK